MSSKVKPIRAAIYVRVSTAEQSVDMQVSELRAFAVARGYTLVKAYEDVGVSGVKSSRPGLDSMLADAVEKRFDVVLVYKIDRVGRSLAHLLTVIDKLTTSKVGFESLHDPGISTTSATGTLMLSIVGAFASYERSLLIERTKSGVALARARGRHVGRPRRELDLRAAEALLATGASVRTVSSMLGVPRRTLRRRLAELEVDQKSPSAEPRKAA